MVPQPSTESKAESTSSSTAVTCYLGQVRAKDFQSLVRGLVASLVRALYELFSFSLPSIRENTLILSTSDTPDRKAQEIAAAVGPRTARARSAPNSNGLTGRRISIWDKSRVLCEKISSLVRGPCSHKTNTFF